MASFIYRPESERLSHYFRARLPEQFDAVLHIDQTTALEPLERRGMTKWMYPRPIRRGSEDLDEYCDNRGHHTQADQEAMP